MATQQQKEEFIAKDILQQFDEAARDFVFPMLDNGYHYPVTCRLTAWRNNTAWNIAIEVVGFNYRGGSHNGITNNLYLFGNNLTHEPGLENENLLYITSNSDEGETFDPETSSFLNPAVNSMLLRGQLIRLSKDPAFYEAKGIRLEEPGKIMIQEMLRGLLPEYREQLLATEEELRTRIPQALELFIRLDDWYHPDVAMRERPSENETFIMLADALETGDKKLFKPTRPANTHWSNWPEGGTL
ncbi:MAG: DUF7003 family protein [Pseudobacter sp.]|uniref:DUF7003 family protein n=1 Tax=Pseudobacter sp. TaxID=2045420 RepID=UPI003F7D8B62